MKFKHLLIAVLLLIVSGCAVYTGLNYDQMFGKQHVQPRTPDYNSQAAQRFVTEIKPILDNRCVVCHACYDAPCQLKLSSVEGIDRGANKNLVYNGTRLTASNPTRLFEDAQTTQEWRDIGFHPILNERSQIPEANLQAGLVARLLTQKKTHPLPDQKQLEGFDFRIDREQKCPTIETLDQYQADHPTWGMPYGMPALSDTEHNTLMRWLSNGAVMTDHEPLSQQQKNQIDKWEAFLNGDSLKQQLTSRYIYEHLFLSHLYFSEYQKVTPKSSIQFFALVRSATPPGQPVKRIATRRPYDNPNVERVYYRLVAYPASIVDKTHQPYALDDKKLNRIQDLFITPIYDVKELPSYKATVAANPMTAFADLPVDARYNFMLDNAQNTIMSFIKGPVCRGQLALNVINDRFWVFFVDPKAAKLPSVKKFYYDQTDNLKLPSEKESNVVPIYQWVAYSEQQARYLEAKERAKSTWFKDGDHLTEDLVWDGHGTNKNAALTIFRHFDSASVVQGLVGTPPKTAWVIDYALLERIQYLLVDGFDVYGNFGHQLMTRMFMDFLRMEGEENFLSLLPIEDRHRLMESWYQDPSPQLSAFIQRDVKPFEQPTNIKYKTPDTQAELYQILKERLAPVLTNRYQIKNTGLSKESEETLRKIDSIKGNGLRRVPQLITVMITSDQGKEQFFTLIHNNSHRNISSLFDEESNRDPENDDLTFVKGIIGSYPSAFIRLKEKDIKDFYQMFSHIKEDGDYIAILDKYGVRRSDQNFWKFSDKLHQWYENDQPIEAGLLDYNRFENR
ncbi:fatty acid cis/trans isomerase [Vibrio rumoiensis]|uniref:9-hexadecenoic acid cis-trans isomerase n=1 Tax=Vibrio rumoiensis 1S-45 TaxID=1188252 RepID=A0A1E5E474_9VIBR|nr:fatty acid cis/trans isomerase [Vibrio rumoiensis]OEF27531.1 9-hexadecenoic acid cis-trans isomerase [Vibrio rumoiensis 1S-45]